jgi:hypothetical protein
MTAWSAWDVMTEVAAVIVAAQALVWIINRLSRIATIDDGRR